MRSSIISFVAAFCDAYFIVLGNELEGRFGVEFFEFACGEHRIWGTFRGSVAFVYVAAYDADKFLVHLFRSFGIICLLVSSCLISVCQLLLRGKIFVILSRASVDLLRRVCCHED